MAYAQPSLPLTPIINGEMYTAKSLKCRVTEDQAQSIIATLSKSDKFGALDPSCVRVDFAQLLLVSTYVMFRAAVSEWGSPMSAVLTYNRPSASIRLKINRDKGLYVKTEELSL